MRYGKFSYLLLALIALFARGIAAQGPDYQLGRAPAKGEIEAWDIDVNPEGKGLPPGNGTAEDGRHIFRQKCAVCHGPTGKEVTELSLSKYPKGNPPPLARKQGEIPSGYYIKSLGNYWPYATTVWDYINRAMPAFRWGLGSRESLNADEVYALTAYLLYQNGIIGETEVMNAETLPAVEMPNRDGFLPGDPGEWRPGMRLDPHISPASPSLE